MALWDKLKGELIDIIQWMDDTRDTLVYRFPTYNHEIQNGGKLVVREGQAAAFVREGALADVFQQPGTYTLDTKNMPIFSTLAGWKYGFESPFKAEVYFVSTRVFTDRKWGTKNPIMLRDPEFGPTRVRAFGTFAIQVSNVAVLLRNAVGTTGVFSVEHLGDQLRDLMTARFADAVAESKIPVLDMAANQDELGKVLLGRINADFEQYGIKVVQLVVENISLPPEVEAAMDKRASMGVLGNLDQYMKFQAGSAMEKAAENPGGTAGLGMGFVMANQLGAMMPGAATGGGAPASQPAPTQPPPHQPPPLPGGVTFHAAIDGKQSGPFDLDALESQIAAGKVTGKTLVWKPGMSSWAAAETVDEFKPLLANVPPPLP